MKRRHTFNPLPSWIEQARCLVAILRGEPGSTIETVGAIGLGMLLWADVVVIGVMAGWLKW
ncbi:MAG: hypothetical protein IE933_03445 [Sphingomonadales bacterium]|nr:hypothetical protein [Sphingomonadales bacterium]MBD3772096.1 hypothetical protein [Paracoccaceae bacterium]